jgi:hypothetical protein
MLPLMIVQIKHYFLQFIRQRSNKIPMRNLWAKNEGPSVPVQDRRQPGYHTVG